MTPPRTWFGTDGIRGRAGEGPLAAPFLVRLGRALGELERPGALVLLARDTRASGPDIVAALVEGLAASGARTVDLGVLPTAGLPLAVRARGADLGIMVSASHNPWADNGVKIFGRDGLKLSDEREEQLEERLRELGGEDGDARAQGPGHDDAGPAGAVRGAGTLSRDGAAACERADGAAAYERAVLARFEGLDLSGWSLAVDCAHGAAYRTAPAVLSALGADVTPLCDAPTGRNINAACGSTHLEAVAAVVRGAPGRFQLGLAFDGDADRVLMVDATGRPCTGDHMLGFLGTWLAARGSLPGRTVVATVMSNLGLERMLAAHDLALHRTPVGDRHVLAAMRERGLGLGGEDSGHLLFADRGHYIGDGLFTALRILEGLVHAGRDLAAAIDAVPRVPQVLLNVPVRARPPLRSLAGLTAAVDAARAEHGDAIRILLRYSGTENVARVMVEGLDPAVVEPLAEELARLWSEQVEAAAAEGEPAA